jgi:hypothetical protein
MSNKISNFISKILLAFLIVIMIAGVAVWGINDILIGSNDKDIATVGNYSISERELDNTVQNQKFQLAQSGLTNISDEISFIIRNNALVNLVSDRLMMNEFENLNLELNGKDVLKVDYISQPDFNKDQLQSVIRSMGGESNFLRKITQDKKIDILQGAITAILPVTDSAAQLQHKMENQTRDIMMVSASPAIMKSLANPSDEELQNFYNENKEIFAIPEAREISYIKIDESAIKDKASEIDVIEQIHDLSGEILDELASGKTLEEISKQYEIAINKTSAITDQGIAISGVKANLPKVNNFLEAAFSLGQDEVSDILESEDAKLYVLARVDKINEKTYKNLDEVKEFAVKGWQSQNQAKQLVDLFSNLKSDLDSGKTTLEKFAQQYGVEVTNLKSISRNSTDFPREFIENIFATEKGRFSEINRDTKNNLIIAQVTNISLPQQQSALELFKDKNKLEEEYSQEIMAQYLEYLKSKYNVKINSK